MLVKNVAIELPYIAHFCLVAMKILRSLSPILHVLVAFDEHVTLIDYLSEGAICSVDSSDDLHFVDGHVTGFCVCEFSCVSLR